MGFWKKLKAVGLAVAPVAAPLIPGGGIALSVVEQLHARGESEDADRALAVAVDDLQERLDRVETALRKSGRLK